MSNKDDKKDSEKVVTALVPRDTDDAFNMFLNETITQKELEEFIKNDIALKKERRKEKFKKALEIQRDRILEDVGQEDLSKVLFRDKIAALKIITNIGRLEDNESTGNIAIKWSD